MTQYARQSIHRGKRMEYKAVKLAHDCETSSDRITDSLNEYARDGWTLHSTQFLPDVESTDPAYGDLLLIFQRNAPD